MARILFLIIIYSFAITTLFGAGEYYLAKELIFQDTDNPIPRPKFSLEPGWYNQPQNLEITAEEGVEMIIYTLDGSEPSLDHLVPSGNNYLVNYHFPREWQESQNQTRNNITYVYEGPIQIQDRSKEENDLSHIITTYNTSYGIFWQKPAGSVFKGQVIRARVIKNGAAGQTKTATCFIDSKKNGRYSLPVLSLSFDTEDLFGYRKGIYVPGIIYFDAGGREANYVDHANFGMRGRAWEMPVHTEFFAEGGTLTFSQNLGMHIHGGVSRSRPMKGFRLYGRNDYDEHNSINHPFSIRDWTYMDFL